MLSVFSRHPLARDITAVLAIKFACIVLASLFLFPAERKPVINSEIVAEKVFGLNDAAAAK